MTKEEILNLKEGDNVIPISLDGIDGNLTVSKTYPILSISDKLGFMLIKDDTGEKINIYSYIEDKFILSVKKSSDKERVNHPDYYNSLPNGIECIDVVRYHDFDTGSAIKYLWRAGLKTEEGISNKQKEIEDLNKAIWYIEDRIKELSK